MNESPTFSRGRRWSIALQVTIAVMAFIAIVVMVNHLSARHFQRFHWSQRAGKALSPRTLDMLRPMTNVVDVTVFFASDSDEDRVRDLYSMVAQLLEEYQAANSNIKITRVDPDLNPAAAERIRNRYNLPSDLDANMVIFSHGDRIRVITDKMLADSEYVKAVDSEKNAIRPRYLAFKGELMFSSAIADVISTRQLKAYFLSGHNEHNPASAEQQMGYASFGDLLRENNIRFDVINLGAAGEIPRDCDLLIIAGPQKEFLPAELDRIEQYLNLGGRMMVMFGLGQSVVDPTGLEARLRQWGVNVGRDVVEDKANGINGQAAFFLSSRYGNHPIVSSLRDVRVQMLYPRTIAKLDGNPSTSAGLNVTELVYSGTNSVVLTQLFRGQFVPTGEDAHGSFPLAVAVEKGGLPGVTTQRGGVTRIVVVGDSFMFGNKIIGLVGNSDFANGIINWLLDRSELMAGILPRPLQEYQLALTPRELTGVRLVLIVGLPAAALILGFFVWLRRRS